MCPGNQIPVGGVCGCPNGLTPQGNNCVSPCRSNQLLDDQGNCYSCQIFEEIRGNAC